MSRPLRRSASHPAGDPLFICLRVVAADQFEAKIGSNAEMASLRRFVPTYATTIQGWLAKRIRGFRPS